MSNWKIISHHNSYVDLYDNSSVIFEFADDFWQLHVDRDKLLDVMNMPSYIVEDWLWVNRMVIDEKTIGYHIERAESDVKHQKEKHQSLMKSAISLTVAEERLALLLSIQRSIKIESIIK